MEQHFAGNTGLMYTKKDSEVLTAEQLSYIKTPAPQGRFHQPISYGDFLDLIKRQLDRNGIEIKQEEYVTSEKGQMFFGCMKIGVENFSRTEEDLILGVRGSHNRKIPRAICIGSRVIVCSNLCFDGDLGNISTRQTLNAWDRIPGMVERAIELIPQVAETENRRVDAYRLEDLSKKDGDSMLVELYRRGGLSGSQLGRAADEWESPSYEEHAEDGFTLWRLQNSVTQALKPTGECCNMHTVRERTQVMREYLDQMVEF